MIHDPSGLMLSANRGVPTWFETARAVPPSADSNRHLGVDQPALARVRRPDPDAVRRCFGDDGAADLARGRELRDLPRDAGAIDERFGDHAVSRAQRPILRPHDERGQRNTAQFLRIGRAERIGHRDEHHAGKRPPLNLDAEPTRLFLGEGLLWQWGKRAEVRAVTARLDLQPLRLGPQQRPSLGSVVQGERHRDHAADGLPRLAGQKPRHRQQPRRRALRDVRGGGRLSVSRGRNHQQQNCLSEQPSHAFSLNSEMSCETVARPDCP